ncbi:MAG TPA: exodeoxyribonuclease VII large subunit, partial [bacterium]|nr:exodeoxyribonuclease VII large subunit [bacterium]
LQQVRVQGEITDYRRPSAGGHHYFTLKDADAALGCVLFSGAARRTQTLPQNGASVIAIGDVGIYAPRGVYQLVLSDLQPVGQGALWLRFLELKARLQQEGLFEEARKRPIPPYPRTVGVVTSQSGAALRDILKVLSRRAPYVRIRIAPALVQGPTAPPQLLQALWALDNDPEVEVIILARGGGSFEDLACFNDEDLARGLARLETPVISGVGHETDFTLVDFVADLRAPTPTAAAALACPDCAELRAAVNRTVADIAGVVRWTIDSRRGDLETVLARPALARPMATLDLRRQQVDDATARLTQALERSLERRRAALAEVEATVRASSPLALLARGYAVVHDGTGRLVRSVAQVRPGDPLTIRMADGTIAADTTATEEQT